MCGSAKQVYIVDDEPDIRESISGLLKSVGYEVGAFGSAEEFLEAEIVLPSCLVVDLVLPAMTGLQLCQKLADREDSAYSFVIVSGHGDISTAVEAMRMGAIDFLEKPFSSQRLLAAVDRGLRKSRACHGCQIAKRGCVGRLSLLTSREREVFEGIGHGLVTKEIASQLGISTRTVDVHRSRIMDKLEIDSPSQLAQIIALTEFRFPCEPEK